MVAAQGSPRRPPHYIHTYERDGRLKSWGIMMTPLPMIICACASPNLALPSLTSSQVMSVCTYSVSGKWLYANSWNFVWTLCLWWPLQTNKFLFPTSAMPSWRILKHVRWDDDAVTHDPQRMRITNLTWPTQLILRLVRMCAFRN
jgi:hypothetical protein